MLACPGNDPIPEICVRSQKPVNKMRKNLIAAGKVEHKNKKIYADKKHPYFFSNTPSFSLVY
jgi:hypothetical protein